MEAMGGREGGGPRRRAWLEAVTSSGRALLVGISAGAMPVRQADVEQLWPAAQVQSQPQS